MDSTVLVFAGVVIVAIVGLWVFRRGRVDVEGRGPGGIGFRVKGDNRPTAGVQAKGVRSESGAVHATDETGRGVNVEEITVHGDVELTNRQPGEPDPKA